MKFSKMNGIGNDYVFVFGNVENPCETAKKLSDRHFSIGSDGLVVIDYSDTADFSMRIFNADGSEAEMCGNAVRCLAKYVYDKGLTDKTTLTVHTLAGIRTLRLYLKDGKVKRVKADMGEPRFIKTERIITSYGIFFADIVDMGNPHAAVYVNALDENSVKAASEISASPLFPEGINAEFYTVNNRNDITMVVWERGSGETMACGTGASAVAFSAFKRGLTDASVTVNLKGGRLKIRQKDGRVYMEGETNFNFEGEVFT